MSRCDSQRALSLKKGSSGIIKRHHQNFLLSVLARLGANRRSLKRIRLKRCCASGVLNLMNSKKRDLLKAILMLVVIALTSCCTETRPRPRNGAQASHVRRYPNLLADIQHDDVHFSVSLDPAEQSFLTIHVSERDSIKSSPTVHVRVLMTNEKVIEGDAQKPRMWYGNGGWSELDYQFRLGQAAALDDLHSVTVTINGQTYELSPF
jgi:hypothetical protein